MKQTSSLSEVLYSEALPKQRCRFYMGAFAWCAHKEYWSLWDHHYYYKAPLQWSAVHEGTHCTDLVGRVESWVNSSGKEGRIVRSGQFRTWVLVMSLLQERNSFRISFQCKFHFILISSLSFAESFQFLWLQENMHGSSISDSQFLHWLFVTILIHKIRHRLISIIIHSVQRLKAPGTTRICCAVRLCQDNCNFPPVSSL